MLWEVEILPKNQEQDLTTIRDQYNLLLHSQDAAQVIQHCSRGYLIDGSLTRDQAERLATELLVDPLVEDYLLGDLQEPEDRSSSQVTVLLKPGVMDPVAQSVLDAAQDLGLSLRGVRTFRRYTIRGDDGILPKVLANDAIEQIVQGSLSSEHMALGEPYEFNLVTVLLRDLRDNDLLELSRSGQLALDLAEMQAIQQHFREVGREPTDVELETIAQTWSEHCSHKTLKGQIDFNGRRIKNLLKETIFGATQEIRQRLGDNDWCVSVFEDNAGIVRFDDNYNVCFKVETHNHPSAIEPYGGANTGLGGVIRDPLGTGLGAKPICNTDVFCFAPPDTPPEELPAGVLHPKQVMHGVVAGVRDYGNRMGIPTVNGAVCFDERYIGNPLVYCGTVGLIPRDRCDKAPQAGDLIVVVGGRTGRDGIHGATFSSIELTHESDRISGGAVQIGNAITQKRLLDVLLQARDRNLYHAITDCGAGGFSSAIGEMGERIGAVVHLDRAPLKYEGLSYTEIWISEAQERMILAVPPENWSELQELCQSEEVEATALGEFEATGRLKLLYQGNEVSDLEMRFLHEGRPDVVREAVWRPPAIPATPKSGTRPQDFNAILKQVLSSYNVCSKEWIIRQYDHEVQGGTVLKPLVGINNDGPGDAATVTPVLGSKQGLAVGCGINPRYGDIDPYLMAAAAIDEAVRNVVAVGADPAFIALLDNFCWGNTNKPETLGSLVRAAEACRDAALALNMPFISGKDSLNNEFHAGDRHIVIPPTLLISALGRVHDVSRCVSMDLKHPGNRLFLVGTTKDELGGSHLNLVTGRQAGKVPQVDLDQAPKIFPMLHEAIQQRLIRSCHDLSEGGLAVAIAEMAFAGGVGVEITSLRPQDSNLSDEVLLFSESTTRFLLEVEEKHVAALLDHMGDFVQSLGSTVEASRMIVRGSSGEDLIDASLEELKQAWQRPLS